MHLHNLFIQFPWQLNHHKYTRQIQTYMSHYFGTALLFTMAPYFLQQFQPGIKQLNMVFLNLGLD